jgi:hypothetical protein
MKAREKESRAKGGLGDRERFLSTGIHKHEAMVPPWTSHIPESMGLFFPDLL